MTRMQWFLAALLAVQALLLSLAAPWSEQSGAAEAQALFPDLRPDEVRRIAVEGDDDASVTLERDGDGWAVSDAGGFPADGSKVDDLLDQLSELEVRRPVVTGSRYHTTLEVTDATRQRRVRVWTDGDDPAVDLLVGSSPNYGLSHVRVAGADPVYEVRGLPTYEIRAESSAWIVRDILDVEADDVRRIAWTNPRGSFAVERDDVGGWTLDGAEGAVDVDKVDAFLRRVADLRTIDAAGRADEGEKGFDAPAGRLSLTVAGDDGELSDLVLEIGAEPPDSDGRRWLRRIDGPWAYEIGAADAEALLGQDAPALAADS